MPIYEFRCNNKDCEIEIFDIFIKMSDRHLKQRCPKCDSTDLTKGLSTGGVVYKSLMAHETAKGGIKSGRR